MPTAGKLQDSKLQYTNNYYKSSLQTVCPRPAPTKKEERRTEGKSGNKRTTAKRTSHEKEREALEETQRPPSVYIILEITLGCPRSPRRTVVTHELVFASSKNWFTSKRDAV
ncbi:hypothetical protein K0M31_004097 [Melipona bicolor]|uniref:Uncharacterized protein n=1 Tax=Melipona bicolor TaxID=60889 RepID=A0AA40FYT6_9HYME|nr:hypothetical protein K0M31_004097 [Melipona bicolor]